MLEGEEAFFHMNFYTVCTVECWEPVGAGREGKRNNREKVEDITYSRGKAVKQEGNCILLQKKTSSYPTPLCPLKLPTPSSSIQTYIKAWQCY